MDSLWLETATDMIIVCRSPHPKSEWQKSGVYTVVDWIYPFKNDVKTGKICGLILVFYLYKNIDIL